MKFLLPWYHIDFIVPLLRSSLSQTAQLLYELQLGGSRAAQVNNVNSSQVSRTVWSPSQPVGEVSFGPKKHPAVPGYLYAVAGSSFKAAFQVKVTKQTNLAVCYHRFIFSSIQNGDSKPQSICKSINKLIAIQEYLEVIRVPDMQTDISHY